MTAFNKGFNNLKSSIEIVLILTYLMNILQVYVYLIK